MAVALTKEQSEKRLIDLTKKATVSLQKSGLEGQRAKVAIALDISGSMTSLYNRGTMQGVCERLLALAMKFDDNGAADVFLFGAKDYFVGEMEQSNFYGFVQDRILKKHNLESSTNYAGVMERITDFYCKGSKSKSVKSAPSLWGKLFGKKDSQGSNINTNSQEEEPAYVLFITDGDNHDPEAAEQAIRDASHLPIFWQFVGVGSEQFQFLKKLDEMEGRTLDNANFFQLNDLDKISDDSLYDRMLGEFPSWIKEARKMGIIK